MCFVCAVTTCCYGSTSRWLISCVRRASAETPSSRTCFARTSTTERTGRRNTAPVSADSKRDRCDRLTSVLTLAMVRPLPVMVADAGEDTSEVCYSTGQPLLALLHAVDKIGRFCWPLKLAGKNLSCVMQKSANFIHREN